jgi:hypothetical protein
MAIVPVTLTVPAQSQQEIVRLCIATSEMIRHFYVVLLASNLSTAASLPKTNGGTLAAVDSDGDTFPKTFLSTAVAAREIGEYHISFISSSPSMLPQDKSPSELCF